MIPSDLTLAHALAIGLLFAAWWLYSPILKLFGRGTLNAQLGVVRNSWMALSIARQNRTFDALLLNQVISSVSFFGSATLIVVAGLIGTFANVKAVHAVIADLHFFAPMSVELLAINLGTVALILGISFFSFTYALTLPLIFIMVAVNPPLVLFGLAFTYALSGPAVWLWRRQRRQTRRAERTGSSNTSSSDS